jgi:hypothetical protein
MWDGYSKNHEAFPLFWGESTIKIYLDDDVNTSHIARQFVAGWLITMPMLSAGKILTSCLLHVYCMLCSPESIDM